MLLCEQAWALAVSGLKTKEIARIMKKPTTYVWTYLYHERKRQGLTAYPFDPYTPSRQRQAWLLAEGGMSRQQIATRMKTTLRHVACYLEDERKHLGLASLPDHLRSRPNYHQRLGNIYHPEVNHRQLFKELAQ